jgi:hypothetical protein
MCHLLPSDPQYEEVRRLQELITLLANQHVHLRPGEEPLPEPERLALLATLKSQLAHLLSWLDPGPDLHGTAWEDFIAGLRIEGGNE